MTTSAVTTTDYYRLLGVSPDATLEEIQAAYRGKVRLYHPDLVADKSEDTLQSATEMTARLNEAYECLSDPDRRAVHDTSRHADTTSAGHPSTSLLVVTPRTLRCEVIPGDTVHLTLDLQAHNPQDGNSLQVSTSVTLVPANFTVITLTERGARLKVRLDTSKLAADRIYHLPILVAWGKLTGATTLEVRTTAVQEADHTPRPRREPASSSRGHWTRRPEHRVRDLTTIGLGGIVLPLLVLAWSQGLFPVTMAANPPLIAAICIGFIAATAWLLTSSRLLRQPDRLARIGVTWGHLMRWSGRILVGSCAVVLGIPVVAGVLTVTAVIASPLLALALIAFIDRDA